MINFLGCSAQGIAVANGVTTQALLEHLVERKILTQADVRAILGSGLECLEPRINVRSVAALSRAFSYGQVNSLPSRNWSRMRRLWLHPHRPPPRRLPWKPLSPFPNHPHPRRTPQPPRPKMWNRPAKQSKSLSRLATRLSIPSSPSPGTRA